MTIKPQLEEGKAIGLCYEDALTTNQERRMRAIRYVINVARAVRQAGTPARVICPII